jgi:peptidoglycan hydrolase CwlO-like protein
VKIDQPMVESIRGLEKALAEIQATLTSFPSSSQEQKDLNDQARHLLGTLTEEIARLRKNIKGQDEMSAELLDMRNQIELNNEILRIVAKKILGENVYIPTFKKETVMQTSF